MTTYKQIESTLPSLSLSELKELKKKITYLLKCSASAEVSIIPATDNKLTVQLDLPNYIEKEFLYIEFAKVFNPEIAPEFAFFLKNGNSKQIELFDEMFEWIQKLYLNLFDTKTRVTYMQFYNFCVKILTDDLTYSTLPFCFRVILQDKRWELLLGLIELRFPGYMQNKQFLLKIFQMLQNKGTVVIGK